MLIEKEIKKYCIIFVTNINFNIIMDLKEIIDKRQLKCDRHGLYLKRRKINFNRNTVCL